MPIFFSSWIGLLGWVLCAVLLGGIIGWMLFSRRAAGTEAVQAPEQAPVVDVELALERDEATVDGPGPMLAKLQECWQELRETTQHLQKFTGRREVQLQAWQRIAPDILRRIVPVLENLEPFLEDDDARVAEVAQVAYGRLITELATMGVTQIIPHAGEAFDWHIHQLAPESTGLPPYQISRVVSYGYRFAPCIPGETDVVLKPADVVAEGLGEETPAPSADSTAATADTKEQATAEDAPPEETAVEDAVEAR
ncbi:MAG: nucleotide exchange factor GrpE [Armatimonadota bacterium]